MKFEGRVETFTRGKKHLKIPIIIDVKDAPPELLRNINNFIDKPLNIEMLIEGEQAALENRQKAERITDKQRGYIYAIIKQYGEHFGYTNEDDPKRQLKSLFNEEHEVGDFSFADCSKELAKDFLEWLIGFGSREGFLRERPSGEEVEYTKYAEMSVVNKKCILCGQAGDIHHVQAIGMGRNRNTYDDSAHETVCLCREHHNEAHTIGWDTFKRKYHF